MIVQTKNGIMLHGEIAKDPVLRDRPDKNGTAASVKCPLVDDWIEPGDCQSNQGVIDRCIPARFKVKQNWKKICEACPFRDY